MRLLRHMTLPIQNPHPLPMVPLRTRMVIMGMLTLVNLVQMCMTTPKHQSLQRQCLSHSAPLLNIPKCCTPLAQSLARHLLWLLLPLCMTMKWQRNSLFTLDNIKCFKWTQLLSSLCGMTTKCIHNSLCMTIHLMLAPLPFL